MTVPQLLPLVGVNLEKGPIAYEVVFDALARLLEAEAVRVEAAEKPAGRHRGKGTKQKRGPKGARYDAKKDREVYEGWQTWKANGGERNIDKYAEEKHGAKTGLEILEIRDTIDRVRKQRRRMPPE